MTNDYQLNRSNFIKILLDYSYTPKISLFKYIYMYIFLFLELLVLEPHLQVEMELIPKCPVLMEYI